MTAHLPRIIGQALKNRRPAPSKTFSHNALSAAVPETIQLSSSAFEDDGNLPPQYTLDCDRISPPMAWRGVPPQARGLILVVEDADSPTSTPLTHAIVLDLPPDLPDLFEGDLPSPHHKGVFRHLRKNSMRKTEYPPPDPPPGHGDHRYLFDLYAVSGALPLPRIPILDDVQQAMPGRILARGYLTARYRRD